MSNTIEKYFGIEKASVMEVDDTLVKALRQLIEYRQKTAVLISKEQDEDRCRVYLEAFEQANKYIKQLLIIS